MRFEAGVSWRISKRGLVVCRPGGVPLLVQHERAGVLPDLVPAAASPEELMSLLGGAQSDRRLVDDLIDERILLPPERVGVSERHAGSGHPRRLVFTRSGIEVRGIERIARWVHRLVMPIVVSWWGRCLIGLTVVGGSAALVMGRPAVAAVSEHPWIDATLGLILGFALAGAHELAHAVALVHYGRTPQAAGCGFYWGALSFYVDCTDGVTLPRRARIINALSGLAVDLAAAAALFITAQLWAASVLAVSVCWRVGIFHLVDIADNALPILEVDGQLALSDALDEPDLSPRAREALGRWLRGIRGREQPPWLATYGAVSLAGGIVLLVGGTWVWWLAAGDLLKALFGGNPAEVLLALYVVIPFAAGVLFSGIGLVVELLARPVAAPAAGTGDPPCP